MSLRKSFTLLSRCSRCMSRQEIRWNCNRAAITRINHAKYPRMYPVTIVMSDGSTIRSRYHEPRQIIRLALDLSKMTEEEKAAILARRKPKQKVVVEEEIDDKFDINEYSHLWKKK